MTAPPPSLLELRDIGKRFTGRGGIFAEAHAVQAVAGVDLDLTERETFGLVGESGCGKSTLGRLVLGLLEPSTGTVRFRGEPVPAARRRPRSIARRIQVIFQDPYASLDPRMSVREIVREPFDIHRIGSRPDRARRVSELLVRVGLEPHLAGRFPHELSGGQRQRVCIARAIALEPELLVADEPVSALDVSIQAQIVNLLLELREAQALTMLFISHDLALVRHLCDRVAVMYLGRIVELGDARSVFAAPRHPYTELLVRSAPHLGRSRAALPSATAGPRMEPGARGCAFRPRCPRADRACETDRPPLVTDLDGRSVACHHPS